MLSVPEIRVRLANAAPIRRDGEFVLYWMIAFRRARWNFALQRALDWATRLNKPLLVLEALRCNYPWASDRLHRFVIDGMADNAAAFEGSPARYFAYVEPRRAAGMGLLETLAERACIVLTDEFPCFFLPGMVARTARSIGVQLETVDSNGLLPLRATDTVFPTAYAFRRFLQKNLLPHLMQPPLENPLATAEARRLPRLTSLPRGIEGRWPAASADLLGATAAGRAELATLPIDHGVGVVKQRGGARAAGAALREFLKRRLGRYVEERNQPEQEVTSGLSPYLHFGHISAHEAFAEIAAQEEWTPANVAEKASGSRAGWWGMSAAAEGFLDEFVTWREVGYNFASQRDDYDKYDSLPEWARASLEKHAADERQWVYSPEQFESGRTHDPLWNAAQMQIVREGRMHNYLRMLWGKKILEWTRHPRDAAEIMIHLNNKYGLDGRNPNSYSGIFWVLGRYDRPWGPERPIFGVIRYMTSENTARKVSVKGYIQQYGVVTGLFANGDRI